MSANLEAKKVLVEEIKEKIQKAKTIVFADYRGLTVAKDTEMRAQIRKDGNEYRVYKNRLVLRALNELGITGCEQYLEGTNAVAFGYADEVSAAKTLVDMENQKAMQVKFGIVNGKVAPKEEIVALASIPSREVLMAKLLYMLKAPVQGVTIALSEYAKKQG